MHIAFIVSGIARLCAFNRGAKKLQQEEKDWPGPCFQVSTKGQRSHSPAHLGEGSILWRKSSVPPKPSAVTVVHGA